MPFKRAAARCHVMKSGKSHDWPILRMPATRAGRNVSDRVLQAKPFKKYDGMTALEDRGVVRSMIVPHPIFNLQSWCLAEMFDVVRDDNCVPAQRMPGNHGIVQPNG